MYPTDDVSEVVLPKKFRTLSSNIPTISRKSSSSNGTNSTANGDNNSSKEQLGHLFTRQALHSYETANHVIQYKYNEFSGSCYDMPK